jgi:hypothetical protein
MLDCARTPNTEHRTPTRNADHGNTSSLRDDIDERALPLGVEMLTRSALRWLEANANP